MRQLTKFIFVFTVLFFVAQSAFAARFVVRHINVQGNQRLSNAAVLSFLPVQIGQTFDTHKSTTVIRSLYQSGYFSDVRLLHRGQTLIVRVRELPVISKLSITGNKGISDKKLKPILSQLGVQIGNVYRPDRVYALRAGLVDAYRNMGRYDVTVNVTVKKGLYNTVALHVIVKEGVMTRVGYIHFVGNHAFSSHKLRGRFQLTTPGLLTIISHHDRYSPHQLSMDLLSLQNFYFNNGYLEFRVVSKDIVVYKNRKRVGITIHVFEGPQYRISGHKVEGKYAHDPIVDKMIDVRVGEVFSRKKILAISARLTHYFADRGYAFPKLNTIPKLDRPNKTVFLTFQIESGRRVYVRWIHLIGNHRTTGKAIRFQLRQLEGAPYSLSKVNESKRRIANLPFFKNIHVTPVRVPGTQNQVDLNYRMKEVNSGRASIQGGYSDVDGSLKRCLIVSHKCLLIL